MLRIEDFQTVKDFLAEAYEVVRSVDVVGRKSEKIIRVEVLKCLSKSNTFNTFKCLYWQYEHITAQPTYPKVTDASGTPAGERGLENYEILVCSDFPWVEADSADLALSQALGFLRDTDI